VLSSRCTVFGSFSKDSTEDKNDSALRAAALISGTKPKTQRSGGDPGLARRADHASFTRPVCRRAARLFDDDSDARHGLGIGEGSGAGTHRSLYLLLAGAFAFTAASIKPTGLLLLLLPPLAATLRWRDGIWITAGAAGVELLVAATLAALGALGPFVTMLRELLPLYGQMGARSLPGILEALQWTAPIAGLALAAALGIAAPKSPRERVMMGLTAFGLIHLLVQQKVGRITSIRWGSDWRAGAHGCSLALLYGARLPA